VTRYTPSSDQAYASLKGLLQCRLLANRLNLAKQRKILSTQSGGQLSKFIGRGIDFSEVRAYQAGDDVRSIDWRVTARTGKPHTKLYAEERERPALVIADQSQSMFFGSQSRFKSVLCAHTAALLAWSILGRGDRLGGIIFSDSEQVDIRPRRSQHTVLKFIQTLLAFNEALNANSHPDKTFSLANSLEQTRRILKPGSELFIVSDLSQFDDESEQHLFQLARHNDIVVIMIYDRLEAQLPPPGYYAVSDGNNTYHAQLYNRSLQGVWQGIFQEKLEQLQTRLARLKIPLVKIRTDDDLLTSLQSGFGIPRSVGK